MEVARDSIWRLIVHDKAVAATVKEVNGLDPRNKIISLNVTRACRDIQLFISAATRKMTDPEFYKKYGGKLYVRGLLNIKPYYYVTLHHMYLNGEFTDQEWDYIRNYRYKNQFNKYFKNYDNKGKFKGSNSYQNKGTLNVTRRQKCYNTKGETSV